MECNREGLSTNSSESDERKILFISPSLRGTYEKSAVRYKVVYSPQLSIAILASVAEKEGFKARICDLNIATAKELQQEIKSFKPGFIAITFATNQLNEAKEIISIVRKNSSAKIIIGGPHVSAMPRQAFSYLKPDFAVAGEGETALRELICGGNYNLINGLVFSKGRKIIANKRVQFKEKLDAVPFPDWTLFDAQKYRMGNSVIGRAESSRGCPFSCSFCDHSVFGYSFNAKSAKRTCEDLLFLKRSGFTETFFIDEILNLDNARLKKLSNLIFEKKIRMPWKVHGIRLDKVDKETMISMKRAGCLEVGVGIESGSNRVLDSIGKREHVWAIKKAISEINSSGIDVFGYFMMGFPGETEQDLKKTIQVARSLKMKFAKVTFFIPYPGSPSFSNLKGRGTLLTTDLSQYAYHKIVFLPYGISEQTLRKYYTRFYLSFFIRPRQLFYLLEDSIKGRTFLYDAFSAFKLLFSTRSL